MFMAMAFYSTSKVRKTDLSVLLEQSVGMLPPCNVLLTVNKFRMFGMFFFFFLRSFKDLLLLGSFFLLFR